MSLKTVELQVALPRTVDNSRIQQIQQNQSSLQNAMAGEELNSQTVRAEQQVADSQANARTELRDRQDKQKRKSAPHNKHIGESDEAEKTPHPYKGHHVDIKM